MSTHIRFVDEPEWWMGISLQPRAGPRLHRSRANIKDLRHPLNRGIGVATLLEPLRQHRTCSSAAGGICCSSPLTECSRCKHERHTHTAPGYDYAAQQWLTGQAGENLALSQMTEEYVQRASSESYRESLVCEFYATVSIG